MKKIGIITIYDLNNYGNRLQNYAVQEFFCERGFKTFTIKNHLATNHSPFNKKDTDGAVIYRFKNSKIFFARVRSKSFKKLISFPFRKIKNSIVTPIINIKRKKSFITFEKKFINTTTYVIDFANSKEINKKFDYFAIGSDQVWNPNYGRISYIFLLSFCPPNKKICFSPSLGTGDIDDLNKLQAVKSEFLKFNYLCTREEAGSELLNKLLETDKVATTLDPTLLISKDKWLKISKSSKFTISKNYILLYFLTENNKDVLKEIKNYAKRNDLMIINLLDKKSKFYNSGPSEFLYLINNSKYFFTDSFHGVIFSIIFNKNFQVFHRSKDDKMYSRINHIIKLLKIDSDVEYDNVIKWKLVINYDMVNSQLENEKKETEKFILCQFN